MEQQSLRQTGSGGPDTRGTPPRTVRSRRHAERPPVYVTSLREGAFLFSAAGGGATAGLLLCSLLPVLFGGLPSVIVGGSMAPRLQVGDVVVTTHVAPA